MGTRGNIIVKESEKGVILVNMYHHMDSYPSGLGVKLADFLKDRVVVNGISMAETRKISNGISDLAAQVVTLLKGSSENSGGVYIQRPKSPLNHPNDYTYIIYPVTETKTGEGYNKKPFTYEQETGEIVVKVHNWKKEIFKGAAINFGIWIENIVNDEEAQREARKLIKEISY